MADYHDDHYFAELGRDLHDFIRPLVVDVLVREVSQVLEEPVARRIAREEVASLCGLALRRLQDLPFTATTPSLAVSELTSIFGEALRDFGGTSEEPGE